MRSICLEDGEDSFVREADSWAPLIPLIQKVWEEFWEISFHTNILGIQMKIIALALSKTKRVYINELQGIWEPPKVFTRFCFYVYLYFSEGRFINFKR